MRYDWKDGIPVALYEGKGPRSQCSNYRPIRLLSVPGSLRKRIAGTYTTYRPSRHDAPLRTFSINDSRLVIDRNMGVSEPEVCQKTVEFATQLGLYSCMFFSALLLQNITQHFVNINRVAS